MHGLIVLKMVIQMLYMRSFRFLLLKYNQCFGRGEFERNIVWHAGAFTLDVKTLSSCYYCSILQMRKIGRESPHHLPKSHMLCCGEVGCDFILSLFLCHSFLHWASGHGIFLLVPLSLRRVAGSRHEENRQGHVLWESAVWGGAVWSDFCQHLVLNNWFM